MICYWYDPSKTHIIEILSIHQVSVIKNQKSSSMYQHTSAPLVLFPPLRKKPNPNKTREAANIQPNHIISELNVAFNTFMHQLIFLNCFNCLFEGAILLCKKKALFSLKPRSAKPFPLRLLVVEGSHQELNPSPVTSKLYSEQPDPWQHPLSGLSSPGCLLWGHRWAQPHCCLEGRQWHDPGHRQPSTVLFPQFAAIWI